MDKLDGMSMDIEATNLEKVKSLFPECVSEGKLDIDKLLSLCGEYIDNDFEKYKFEWKGKSECLRLAQKRSTGTLRPCESESAGKDGTSGKFDSDNLYIEGDNLEVLKLLQTAYYRKVKMIYIDPPYNTGNDFVYEDDFADPIYKYKEVTSQTTKSNPETMGRYHTNWLNMMYPRLRLAANLLRDDGVIFISIDDNEVHNLRKLCDEVFGEENFLGEIIQNKQNSKNDTINIQKNHEYLIVYRKSILLEQGGTKVKPTLINSTIKARDIFEENGKYYYVNDAITTRGDGGVLAARPNLGYTVYYNPTTKDKIAVCDYDISKATTAQDYSELYTTRNDLISTGYVAIRPPKVRGQLGVWTWSLEKFNEQKSDIVVTGKSDSYAVKKRTFVSTESVKNIDGKLQYTDTFESNVRSLWDFSTNDGTKTLNDVMGNSNIFSNAKNLDMIKNIISLVPDKDALILDFFSGSATTAHAVMQLNAEDGGNRKFIMVQLPEVCDEKSEAYKAGYKNICEIGKERIRRAGAKIAEIKYENDLRKGKPENFVFLEDFLPKLKEEGIEQVKMNLKKLPPILDTGFKVFKLDTSNLVTWDSAPIENHDIMTLLNRLNAMTNSVKSDRTDMDVVAEIMLKMGVPLDIPVTKIDINNKAAYAVGDYLLLICLADNVTAEDMEKLCDLAPGKLVIAESSFTDTSAMRNANYIVRDRSVSLKLV